MKPQKANNQVAVLPAQDVMETLASISKPVTTTILDPWYNKGVGGVRRGYLRWLTEVVHRTADISDHIFVWGFPEILYPLPGRLPKGFGLVA